MPAWLTSLSARYSLICCCDSTMVKGVLGSSGMVERPFPSGTWVGTSRVAAGVAVITAGSVAVAGWEAGVAVAPPLSPRRKRALPQAQPGTNAMTPRSRTRDHSGETP